MVDHALTGPVQGLDVLLLDGLRRHEAHVRLSGSGADGLGVVADGLLAPHEGLDVLRADDLHSVVELLELPLPIEGTGAGFDGDGAGLGLRDDLEQLVAHHATSHWRLRRWLCLKHKVRIGQHVRFPDTRLHDTYGLTLLSRQVIGLPSAKA